MNDLDGATSRVRCMMAAPLMMGNDLRNLDPKMKDILTAEANTAHHLQMANTQPHPILNPQLRIFIPTHSVLSAHHLRCLCLSPPLVLPVPVLPRAVCHDGSPPHETHLTWCGRAGGNCGRPRPAWKARLQGIPEQRFLRETRHLDETAPGAACLVPRASCLVPRASLFLC